MPRKKGSLAHEPVYSPEERKIHLLLKRVGQDRGRRSEECFFKAFQEDFAKPVWFERVERSSFREDWLQGIDAWLVTDWGNIPIQIKSSEMAARQFRRRGLRRVKVIVIDAGDTLAVIRQKLFAVVKGDIWRRSKGHRLSITVSA
ncbi:MAG: hypothetical protein AAB645_00960 [Patescibacteria group bacterium]